MTPINSTTPPMDGIIHISSDSELVFKLPTTESKTPEILSKELMLGAVQKFENNTGRFQCERHVFNEIKEIELRRANVM